MLIIDKRRLNYSIDHIDFGLDNKSTALTIFHFITRHLIEQYYEKKIQLMSVYNCIWNTNWDSLIT